MRSISMNGPNDALDYCIIADFRIVRRLWCEEERQHHYERRSITHVLVHLIHKNALESQVSGIQDPLKRYY